MSFSPALDSQDTHVNIFNLTPVIATLAIVSCLLSASTASANTISEQIDAQVSEAIKQHFLTKVPDSRLEIRLNPVDSRLKLSPCSTPLRVKLPFQSGQRITAKVSCPQPRWSLFVTGQVQQYKTIVVATTPIVKGARVSARHLDLRERDITTLSGDYYQHQHDVVGRVARINISAETAITPRMLAVAKAIKRGDPVVIEARRGSVSIRTDGVAQEDGKAGETITVINSRSGMEIRARVIAPGKVQVP